MELLHNSKIKKDASNIFELNQFDEPIDKVIPFVQPVKEIESEMNLIKSFDDPADGTLISVPVDRNVYLKEIDGDYLSTISGWGTITLRPENEASVTITIHSNNTDYKPFHYAFAGQGLKLEKGSAVTIANFNGDHTGSITLIGYYGSDRS